MSRRTGVAVRRARSTRRGLRDPTGAALAAVPAAAEAVGIEVAGSVLKVSLGPPAESRADNGVLVLPLPDGGAIVSLHGSVSSRDKTVERAASPWRPRTPGRCWRRIPGAAPRGSPRPAASRGSACSRVGCGSQSASQGWSSTLNLPTNVTSTSQHCPGTAGQAATRSRPAPAATASPARTRTTRSTRAGRPTRDRRRSPPIGNAELDDPNRNIVNGGGGNDTFPLTLGTGRDVVTGGAGHRPGDVCIAASASARRAPSACTSRSTAQANDGDPNIDQPDSTALGRGRQHRHRRREPDRHEARRPVDRQRGGEHPVRRRGRRHADRGRRRGPDPGPRAAKRRLGYRRRDQLRLARPRRPPSRAASGCSFQTATGNDRLQADLADPKPADCELLVDMAVDEPRAGGRSGAPRGGSPRRRLAVRLACPRKAGRTCRESSGSPARRPVRSPPSSRSRAAPGARCG